MSQPISPALKRIIALIVFFSVVFVVMCTQGYMKFKAYQKAQAATWIDGSPWNAHAFSIPECLQAGWQWQKGCDGLPTLCKLHSQTLFHGCLKSQDRKSYCDTMGAPEITKDIYKMCNQIINPALLTLTLAKERSQCNAMGRVIDDVCRGYKKE